MTTAPHRSPCRGVPEGLHGCVSMRSSRLWHRRRSRTPGAGLLLAQIANSAAYPRRIQNCDDATVTNAQDEAFV